MLLTIEQTNELLNIIDRNQKVIIFKELGSDFLTENDKSLLSKHGVDLHYLPQSDTVFTSFHLGLLAESLGAAETKNLSFEQLRNYIAHGDYIPLTFREQATINSIKAQSFNDLKSLNGKIFRDVNQILIDGSLKTQRQFLKDEIIRGTLNKESLREIANGIAEKTGDWSRDFDRIVACSSQSAFEEGKAAMIERNAGGEDPDVYKTVFDGACSHCIRLYLTNGIGSQPIIFKLSALRANGTNIGRKVAEWKAVLGFVHPFCRCRLNWLQKGYIWDDKSKTFILAPQGSPERKKRAPIRIWIGGEERFV